MNTSKKVAVISGGAGYLGSAISQKLVDNDFIVVALVQENSGVSTKENIYFKRVDITSASAVRQVADEVKEEFGEVFTVIHCASAPLVRRPILSLSEDDFKRQFEVNVFGGFYFFKYFSGMMNENGALIGTTSSAILPKASHGKNGSYAAAKYGLQGMLLSLVPEVSFRIYSVAPSFMPGGLNNDLPTAAKEIIIKTRPPQEITDPNEVAEAILSLVNDTEKKWNGDTILLPGFVIV